MLISHRVPANPWPTQGLRSTCSNYIQIMHRDEARKRGGKVGRIMGGGKGAERGEEGKEKEERAMLGRGCEFVLRITPPTDNVVF